MIYIRSYFNHVKSERVMNDNYLLHASTNFYLIKKPAQASRLYTSRSISQGKLCNSHNFDSLLARKLKYENI